MRGLGNDALDAAEGDDVGFSGPGGDTLDGGPDTDAAARCETVTNVP